MKVILTIVTTILVLEIMSKLNRVLLYPLLPKRNRDFIDKIVGKFWESINNLLPKYYLFKYTCEYIHKGKTYPGKCEHVAVCKRSRVDGISADVVEWLMSRGATNIKFESVTEITKEEYELFKHPLELHDNT